MINDPHDVPPLLEITQQEKELTCRFCEQLVCACDDDERLAALFPSYAALLAFTIATKDKLAALTARGEQAVERAAFDAGWAAAKRDDDALDAEDVADAPDVAWLDYRRAAR